MLATRPHAGRKREELQPPDLHSFVQGRASIMGSAIWVNETQEK